jgi:hypothetical protein
MKTPMLRVWILSRCKDTVNNKDQFEASEVFPHAAL